MIETTLITIFIAILSGLTVLAYRHLDKYIRLMRAHIGWFVGLGIAYLVFKLQSARYSAYQLLYSSDDSSYEWKLREFRETIVSLQQSVDAIFIGFLVVAAVVIYLMVILPWLIGEFRSDEDSET